MKRNSIQLIFLGVLCLIAAACFSSGTHNNDIEFRLNLTQADLSGKAYDTIQYGTGTINVWRLPYLTERDIEKVRMLRSISSPDTLLLSFEFNEDGKRRLYRFTKRFAKRKVGIFANGRLVANVEIAIPIFTGQMVVVTWPWSEKELKDFVKKVNTEAEGRLSGYLIEQQKINEAIHAKLTDVLNQFNKYMDGTSEEVKKRPEALDNVE